jgi:hypothetical protein
MNQSPTPRIAQVIGASGEITEPVFGRGKASAASGLVAVDAKALRQLLEAVTGPGHHIRELQATRSLHALGHPNPIDTLIDSYNAAVAATGERA